MQCPIFGIGQYGVYDSVAAGRKGTQTKERCVARYEIELFTSDGPGAAFLDGREYPQKRGMLLCAKPGQLRHSRLPLRCHYIHVLTEDPALRAMLDHLPDVSMPADMGSLGRLFHELAQLPESDSIEDRMILQSTAAKLLAAVSRATTGEVSGIGRSSRAALADADDYIRNHLADSLSLEELAERANFSPAHFHRIFTACFGKTPHEYVLSCRMEAAMAALRSDSCTLSDLAAACGFSSHSYFSYQFKKTVGMTPMQYRRQMLSRLDG